MITMLKVPEENYIEIIDTVVYRENTPKKLFIRNLKILIE